MTTYDDVALVIMKNSPTALCDDCIAAEVQVSPRQHTNRNTRELAKFTRFYQRRGACGSCGKTKLVISYSQAA
jgi:hypothetical protein